MQSCHHMDLLSQHAHGTLLFLTPGERRSPHIQSASLTVVTAVVEYFKWLRISMSFYHTSQRWELHQASEEKSSLVGGGSMPSVLFKKMTYTKRRAFSSITCEKYTLTQTKSLHGLVLLHKTKAMECTTSPTQSPSKPQQTTATTPTRSPRSKPVWTP
jgi:hypothetical protein